MYFSYDFLSFICQSSFLLPTISIKGDLLYYLNITPFHSLIGSLLFLIFIFTFHFLFQILAVLLLLFPLITMKNRPGKGLSSTRAFYCSVYCNSELSALVKYALAFQFINSTLRVDKPLKVIYFSAGWISDEVK